MERYGHWPVEAIASETALAAKYRVKYSQAKEK
ncbi:hypothetical protein UC8_10760 [Roseimaritima ulvae]|uniref:Uncharacterized protein n=1 Tax=Roseimaritima ulvae TaxID=980254 RepID=A0A5B9QNQ2_9BACT|nr:hypothetical protein UC8_10760 [Roseimaritima ulvae]